MLLLRAVVLRRAPFSVARCSTAPGPNQPITTNLLPRLARQLITGIVEGIIFFDIITDLVVALALYRENYISAFVLSMILIITPHFIAWASVWSLIDKKRDAEKHIIFRNKFRYELFLGLFGIAPVGVFLLLLFDIWNVFQFIVVRPLWFGGTQKLFRADTFEELGYRKLRRVSEVCSETSL